MAGSDWILDVNDKSAIESLVADSLATVLAAVATIDTSDPDMLATYDSIVARAREEESFFAHAAEDLGVEITAPMKAILLLASLYNWFKGGDEAFLTLLPDLRGVAASLADSVLAFAGRAVDGLRKIQWSGYSEPVAVATMQSLLDLGHLLDGAGHANEASRCALAGMNLVLPRQDRYVEAADLAVRSARSAGEHVLIARALVRRAQGLAERGEDSPAERLAAFDSYEHAARFIESGRTGDLAGILVSLARAHAWLEPLVPLAVAKLPEGPRPPLVLPPQVAAALQQRWDIADAEEWFTVLQNAGVFAMEIENRRLELDTRPTAVEFAETSWESINFDHPAYQRSVPDGLSFVREARFQELVLVLNHEITHVVSLFSGVGTALLALRLAALEVEIRLWTFTTGGEQVPHPTSASPPAPLETSHVIALAQAEQALELTLKKIALQGAWTPWFEGLAMFSELAVDPAMDHDAYPQVVTVLANLSDRGTAQEAEHLGAPLQDVVRAIMEESETAYETARSAVGALRLRGYLEVSPERYLPGYLLVRSVVGAWRLTLGKPISGAQAVRLLIGVTRFGTRDAVPDLALPYETFAEEAIAGVERWLEQVSSMTAADLMKILDAYVGRPQAVAFREGRVVTQAVDALEWRHDAGQLRDLSRQALRTLSGDNAPPLRVPDADDACRVLMQAASAGLKLAEMSDWLVTDDALGAFVGAYAMLPIGTVEAPFWLNKANRTLAYLARTREEDPSHGGPSYNLHARQVSEEDFARLERALADGESFRLTVTRLADLRDEPAGRNYTALQLGDWLSVESRGLALGAPAPDDMTRRLIGLRLDPVGVFGYERDVVAKGEAGARRTLEWLSRVDSWTLDDEVVPLGPWARYVQDRARQVLAENERPHPGPGYRLLRTLLPDDLVDEIEADGLRGAERAGEGGYTRLLGALMETGLRPSNNAWLEALDGAGAGLGGLVSRTPFGWDVVAQN